MLVLLDFLTIAAAHGLWNEKVFNEHPALKVKKTNLKIIPL